MPRGQPDLSPDVRDPTLTALLERGPDDRPDRRRRVTQPASSQQLTLQEPDAGGIIRGVARFEQWPRRAADQIVEDEGMPLVRPRRGRSDD